MVPGGERPWVSGRQVKKEVLQLSEKIELKEHEAAEMRIDLKGLPGTLL